MIGVIPAAGAGERIQPLGCSKELLPVGARKIDGAERPKAVAEYLVERMIAAGAEQICMVISAEKSDIVRYFASRDYAAEIFYVVQRRPQGLCDALFRAEPFARGHDQVLIGLPDTIWFPENAYRAALDFAAAEVNLVLFPVRDPSAFDAVVCDEQGYVAEVEVKRASAHSHWIRAIAATFTWATCSMRISPPAMPCVESIAVKCTWM
jgi:glucose-1-phosphate thymidylyltransferase